MSKKKRNKKGQFVKEANSITTPNETVIKDNVFNSGLDVAPPDPIEKQPKKKKKFWGVVGTILEKVGAVVADYFINRKRQ